MKHLEYTMICEQCGKWKAHCAIGDGPFLCVVCHNRSITFEETEQEKWFAMRFISEHSLTRFNERRSKIAALYVPAIATTVSN